MSSDVTEQVTDVQTDEELSDADELLRKAEAMRDDGYFDVSVLDWQKVDGHTGTEVEVTVLRPDNKKETVRLDWPEKPTEGNTFIKACMVALGVDSPQEAALMADDLQGASPEQFTVPADVSSGGNWTLVPEAADQKRLQFLRGEEGENSLSPLGAALSFIGGPITVFWSALVGTVDEPGTWFTESESSIEVYWLMQQTALGVAGTVLWSFLGLLLLIML